MSKSPLASLLCALPCLLMLGGCDESAPAPSAAPATTPLHQRMATEPDPGFLRAEAARTFDFPRDHGPHPGFATEWWYATGNLASDAGRAFGYQLTLFRIGLKPGQAAPDSWRTAEIYMGHLAISDLQNRHHHHAERFSRAALGLAGARAEPLEIWLGDWRISGGDQQGFPLRLQAADASIAIDLSLQRGRRPLVLQGEQGLSRKSAAPGNASYYYSLTRLPSAGRIRLGEEWFEVSGNSWLDREWSSSALGPDQAGWDWFALQLDDGRDLMFYRMRDRQGRMQRFSSGILLDQQGQIHPLGIDQVDLQPLRYWQAPSGERYPLQWRLVIAEQGIDLNIEAAFDDQLMATQVRYWEGAVRLSGSQGGVGYMELSGYETAP